MSNKLGVLQVIDSLNTGGAEVLSVNIANLLKKERVNSHICVTRQEGKLKENISSEVGYIFLNRKKIIDLKAILSLKKYIRNHKIKVIHAHSSSVFFAICVKLISFKLKIIWHDHYGENQDLENRSSFFLKIMSYFIENIISVNTNLKQWAENKLYCKNVFFLNNFPIFNNSDEVTFLKGNKGKRIVHLAAFREQKDHETLISAFEIFFKKNKDWSLHLIGNLEKNEYTNKILSLIEAKGLKKHIFVYGSKLDIKHILKQATIGILSSRSEGLPVALLEYGLAKLPVIVTNVGECSKVVVHQKSGLVVNSQSKLELSDAMYTLAKSEVKRDEFKNNHYLNILENYSSQFFIKQVLKIYTK
ncbi:glycosyltransferase [uncultured Polaribacter sp.]|uniref:glycosyltransferase n=1 Tax=uncultured Polaribacter sp. TaxID=174711 RepID=UPI002620285A|nr:glycosyltransferase [uncultured Polaribacter sp.]